MVIRSPKAFRFGIIAKAEGFFILQNVLINNITLQLILTNNS